MTKTSELYNMYKDMAADRAGRVLGQSMHDVMGGWPYSQFLQELRAADGTDMRVSDRQIVDALRHEASNTRDRAQDAYVEALSKEARLEVEEQMETLRGVMEMPQLAGDQVELLKWVERCMVRVAERALAIGLDMERLPSRFGFDLGADSRSVRFDWR